MLNPSYYTKVNEIGSGTKILDFMTVVDIKIATKKFLLIDSSKCRTVHEGDIRNSYNYSIVKYEEH